MRKVGEFISVKIENMSIQHTESDFTGEKSEQAETKQKKKNGIVAVSNGPGISAIFTELGTDVIVPGGQTNNPSTNDFIEAFDKINAENIFVFPNNGNIVMAATQAAEIYEKAKVYVIPAKTIGTGYVALSSMNFDTSSPDELVNEADEAISRVVSAYISPAVRDADMNGVHINDGDTIAIINKEIVVSEPERNACAKALVDKMLEGGDRFLLTVFIGADATAKEAAELEGYVTKNYPDTEVYFIDGGQEIYPYLFVAE
jgi:dihydroxyacetone kinase-like predicted kinase